MERKLIESIINGIVRQGRDSIAMTLDGIALLLCRNNRQKIRSHLSNKEFDFENLFANGSYVVKYIQRSVPEEHLKLLYKNFEFSAEVLLDYVQTKVPRFFEQQGSVKESISRMMMRLLDPQNGDFIYNPFGGDYYAPIAYPGTRFLSEVISQKESRYLQLVMAAKWQDNVVSRPSNPFMRPESESEHFNLIYIPALPFGIRIAGMGRKIEEDFVMRMMNILVPGGRMVVILPSVALSADTYFELRKTLAETGYLRSITLLGAGSAYKSTAISTAIFEIVKEPNPSGLFHLYNATSFNLDDQASMDEFYRRVDNKDPETSVTITLQSLYSSRNLQIFDPSAKHSRIERPGFKNVMLRSILEYYSNPVELDGTELVARLSGKDMHLKLPAYKIDVQDVEITKARGRFTCISEPVFCFHGITQNFLWCVGEEALPVYCNSDIYTFKIRDSIVSPEYLCFVLNEDDIVADIKSRIAGATIQRISRQSLLDVEIPIPDEDRCELFKQEMERFISERKTRLAERERASHQETIEDIKEDIKDKIHLLGPYNQDIQTGLNRILGKLNKGETLDAHSKVFKNFDVELADFIQSLLNKSVDAGYITASIGGSMFETVDRPLDSFVFLQEYVAYLQCDNSYRDIEISLERIAATYALMIDGKALKLVLDTIVRNAVRHGFASPISGHKEIKISITGNDLNNMAVISIANNGARVAADFDASRYGDKFWKCGRTGNTGRGGHFVKSAMDFYKGTYSIDTNDEEWPFVINLYIPMSHE